MRADVVQPQRPRVGDQDAEHAAPAREVADRAVGLLVDPGGEEALELLAALVEHADRGVARAGELARDLEQPLEHRLGVEHGDERAADVDQASQAVFVHAGRRPSMTRAERADRSKTTVVIADDHTVVRQGLRMLIDNEEQLQVLAEAGTVPDAERLTKAHRPDVLVLDLNMPGGSGLEAIPRLREHTAIVVLTMQDDPGVRAPGAAGGRARVRAQGGGGRGAAGGDPARRGGRHLPQPAARRAAGRRPAGGPAGRPLSSARSRCCG